VAHHPMANRPHPGRPDPAPRRKPKRKGYGSV